MQTLIKWPGGKTQELEIIKKHIPQTFGRYVEPFFGGGALFFDMCPDTAIINDISENLMSFYSFIGRRDKRFAACITAVLDEWKRLNAYASETAPQMFDFYALIKSGAVDKEQIREYCEAEAQKCAEHLFKTSRLIFDGKLFQSETARMLADKMTRTARNEQKNGELKAGDLEQNIATGFTAGYYMYMRTLFNRIEKGDYLFVSEQFKCALFFFVREFCYGSMFRYNSKGEFNIPYGGIAYNSKDFGKKVNALLADETERLLENADIRSEDFEKIFSLTNEDDFIFLDPPYDTDFSDYEYNKFGKTEHLRLAECIYASKAKVLLIIKYTPFIHELYDGRGFNISYFDNHYAYCVRNRNDRSAEHMIITNY